MEIIWIVLGYLVLGGLLLGYWTERYELPDGEPYGWLVVVLLWPLFLLVEVGGAFAKIFK